MSDTPFNVLQSASISYEQDKPMTVGQLIEHLKAFDDDVLVQIEYSVTVAVNDDEPGEWQYQEPITVVISQVDRDEHKQRWVTLA